MAPIGVFDSGLGGLTVLRALVDAAPSQPFVYFGDNANAPYGARDPQDVAALTRSGVETLFSEGCRLVVVACNTAAALGLRSLQQSWLPARQDGGAPPLNALGVFAPMVEAMTGRPWTAGPAAQRLGPPRAGPEATAAIGVESATAVFFATPATVASGAFEREVAARAPSVRVCAEACPGLADAIEAGARAEAAALATRATANALARLRRPPDVALLGCTHYPLAQSAFRAALPAETTLLHQPSVVAASLARYLARRPGYEALAGPARAPRLRCLTSGDSARVGALASAFFGAALQFERPSLGV